MAQLSNYDSSETLKNKFNNDFLKSVNKILSGKTLYFTRNKKIIEFQYEQAEK